jgi:hypothetical protein
LFLICLVSSFEGISNMTIELPVLRLGLAGFSTGQQEQLSAAVARAAGPALAWEVDQLAHADAWWINGARAQLLPGATLRVTPAEANGRSLQLHLPDIDRPVAYSTPLACADLARAPTFDPASAASINAVLDRFESHLSPLTAQFSLASHIVEHQAALGGGSFGVVANGHMIAVVNMRGDIGVQPRAGPAEFENAEWRRRPPAAGIPEHFARTDLSQLMWQYTLRTQRDLLPRHYRTGPLYFRRPPRLPHRVLRDSHLLLMRELAGAPASFEALQQRTGLNAPQLARDLASLYFVGSITANVKRAAPVHGSRLDEGEASQGSQSSLPSEMDSVPPRAAPIRPNFVSDLTAPAPMGPR